MILINAKLRYPSSEADFVAARLDGKFCETLAAKHVVCVEIQLMLNDFHLVKKLAHKFYKVHRAENLHDILGDPIAFD